MSISTKKPVSGWKTVAMAIGDIRRRLLRATAALKEAGIPYAVLGGHAVAEWVGRVDRSAVRFTRDVDILLRRPDLPPAIDAMQNAGFLYHGTLGVEMFLDGPDASPKEAVHVVFAHEKVRDEYVLPAPDVDESEPAPDFTVLSLEALVRMKLTSFRRKDQVHLLDMLDVELIDASWCQRFPPVLAARLQELIDNPEG